MGFPELCGVIGQAIAFEHFQFAGSLRAERRDLLGGVDLIERGDTASLPAGAVGGGAGLALGIAAPFAGLGGADPQAGVFSFGGARHGVAVGLVAGEQEPGEGDELAGGGDDGDVAVLLGGQAAEEDAEGAGMEADVLGGLDEHPAGVAAALLGDAAVVAVLAGLVGGGDEAEIGGGLVGGGEAGGVAEGGEQGLGDGEIDAGQAHEELDPGVVMSMLGHLGSEEFDFGFDVGELAEVAVEGLAARGIEVELGEPAEVGGGEEIAGRGLDEALVEDGVDAVLEAGAVADEVGALGGEVAEGLGGGIGDPDGGEELGAEELDEDLGIDLVGFDAGFGDGAGFEGVGGDNLADEGLEQGGDGPGVGGGFEGEEGVWGEVVLSKVEEGGAGGGEAAAVEGLALVIDDDGLDDFLVEIEGGKWHTDDTLR